MNVAQVFGYSIPAACTPHIQVAGVTRAGIEIELENITSSNLNTDYWRSITDGSLRNNGREFVFNGAHGGADLFLACVELDTFLGRQTPDGSWRCSTHVHVDVRELNSTQIKNIILTYLVYEKLLFRLSGFHRYTNNFCAAFGFAQNQLRLLADNWNQSNEGFMNRVSGGWDKYSALNLRPMANFGSIEFRSSAAEWRKGKLIRLANRFLSIRDFGAAWEGSHEDLIQHLVTLNPRDIMKKGITPKDLPSDWEEDVSVGIKLAHDLLAFASQPVESVASHIQTVTTNSGELHVSIDTSNLVWMTDKLRRDHSITVVNTSVRGDGAGHRLIDFKFINDFCALTNVSYHDLLNGRNCELYRAHQRASQGTMSYSWSPEVPPPAPILFEDEESFDGEEDPEGDGSEVEW